MKELFKINNATTYTLSKVNEGKDSVEIMIKGDVCHYNVKNQNYEIDKPGCFSSHIKLVKDNNQTIPLVLNHNEDTKVGKIVEFEDGASYLWANSKFTKTKNFMENILPQIEDGIYPCFSTCGWATKGYWDEAQDAYIVEEGKLLHISLVSQGADVKANAMLVNDLNNFRKKDTAKKYFWI